MSVNSLLEILVERLGGEHAVVEQLNHVHHGSDRQEGLEESAGFTEDSPGYCYLRLLDGTNHRDAVSMGAYPTVADVRRFANSRSNPFGNRLVKVVLHGVKDCARADVVYYAGNDGLSPVVALAALAKDVQVGGREDTASASSAQEMAISGSQGDEWLDVPAHNCVNPDGVADDFPPGWIPADMQVVQTWDFIGGEGPRALDCLGWTGDRPKWLSDKYEPVSAASSRVRWVLRANPLGPDTGTIDIIDPSGRAYTTRQWTSKVAHTGYHQGWRVRGHKVFAEAYIWRAAKILSDPSAPDPTPAVPPSGRHGELFRTGLVTTRVNNYTSDAQGYCYLKAFSDQSRALKALGSFPTVKEVKDYAMTFAQREHSLRSGAFSTWGTNAGFQYGQDGVHHVTDDAGIQASFWETVDSLPLNDKLGATQADAVIEHEQAGIAPLLTLPVKGQSMVLHVPFATKLGSSLPYFTWNLAMSGKVKAITDYFESCELESLTVKALVHKGDADSMLSVVAESGKIGYENDMAWVGATHALHLSGNSNGGTTGELVLSGNHGFGTQLKGLAVGNPTPYLQAKFDSTAGAVAYLRIVLVIRVAGAGLPGSVIIASKAAPAAGVVEDDALTEEVSYTRSRRSPR